MPASGGRVVSPPTRERVADALAWELRCVCRAAVEGVDRRVGCAEAFTVLRARQIVPSGWHEPLAPVFRVADRPRPLPTCACSSCLARVHTKRLRACVQSHTQYVRACVPVDWHQSLAMLLMLPAPRMCADKRACVRACVRRGLLLEGLLEGLAMRCLSVSARRPLARASSRTRHSSRPHTCTRARARARVHLHGFSERALGRRKSRASRPSEWR